MENDATTLELQKSDVMLAEHEGRSGIGTPRDAKTYFLAILAQLQVLEKPSIKIIACVAQADRRKTSRGGQRCDDTTRFLGLSSISHGLSIQARIERGWEVFGIS